MLFYLVKIPVLKKVRKTDCKVNENHVRGSQIPKARKYLFLLKRLA